MGYYSMLFWEPREVLQGADFGDLICGSTKERRREGRGGCRHPSPPRISAVPSLSLLLAAGFFMLK